MSRPNRHIPRSPLLLLPGTALAAVLALAVLAAPAQAGEILVLAADQWCPYTCEEGPRTGFLTEIVRQALKARGYSTSYAVRPWNRAIIEAQSGRVDGLIGSTVGELPDFAYPECNLGTTPTTFFVRAGDSWRYAGLQSLRGKRVGIVEGYPYGEPLDTEIREHPERFAKSWGEGAVTANLRALATGRVDVIPEDPLVAAFFVRSTGQPEIFQEAGTLPEPLEVSVAFRPGSRSQEFAAAVCAGIENLRRSGKLQAILANYGIPSWP